MLRKVGRLCSFKECVHHDSWTLLAALPAAHHVSFCAHYSMPFLQLLTQRTVVHKIFFIFGINNFFSFSVLIISDGFSFNSRPRWKLPKLSMKCTQNFSRGFNQFSSRNWRSSFHLVGILVQKKPRPETGAFIVTCNRTTRMKKKLFHQPLQHTLRFQVLARQAVKVLPAVAQPVSFTPHHTPWKI